MDTLIVYTAKYAFVISLVIAACVWLRLPSRQKTELLAWGVLGGALAYILVKAAGALFYDTRPFVTDHTAPLFAHPADNGFPSDHATLAATVALLVMTYRRWLGVVLLAASVSVGVARVAAHVHHGQDIVAGVVIAVVAVGVTTAAWAWVRPRLPGRLAELASG